MIQEIREKISQTGLIPLSEETLPLIKAGMYWYEGDEFSEQLIAEKRIKSVVLLVKGRAVYGDTFIEENISSDKFSFLVRQMAKQANGLEVSIIPSVLLYADIASSVALINEALAVLGKEGWRGTYLTSSSHTCFKFWTASFPSGSRSFIGKGSTCKVRKILEHYVI